MENFKQEVHNNPDQFAVMVVTWNKGTHYFDNLTEAKKMFPDLDPFINGNRFTWAMWGGYQEGTGKPMMRFDDWESERHLSI